MGLVIPETFQNASFLSTHLSGVRNTVVPVIHNSGLNDSSGWSIVVLPRFQRFKDQRLAVFQSHCHPKIRLSSFAKRIGFHEMEVRFPKKVSKFVTIQSRLKGWNR